MLINWDFFTRKKKLESVQLEGTKFARVLNTFDLTSLGKIFLTKFLQIIKELIKIFMNY